MRYTFISLLGLLLVITGQAQNLSLYQKKWLIQDTDTLPYRILLPEDYDTTKKYPLLLFLHGGGERGSDNSKQLTHGAQLFLTDSIRKQYPAIVVFPQCALNSYWSNVVQVRDDRGNRTFHFQQGGEPSKSMQLLLQLVPLLKSTYRLDENRLYIGGLSMGAMGTYELVRRMPKTFAAAIAICGGAHPQTAKGLKNTAWWVFHGAEDAVVPPAFSEAMVQALKKEHASVRFTLYPGVNHNSWDNAFAEKDLFPWLFGQRRTGRP